MLQNISQYVVRDDENQTAYLKLPNEGYWWSWYGSEIETDAFYLKLLARTDPKGELAPRLVKYVLNNRKHGTYWNSTRDTAFCIEALADYLEGKRRGPARDDGGHRPRRPDPQGSQDHAGRSIHIRQCVRRRRKGSSSPARTRSRSLKQGKGPLYYNAYLTNFTLEDPITRAGLEIKVDRKVYRLIKDDKTVDTAGGHGQTVGQRVERYRREQLPEGATLKSGELVEVELEIDSKNDYEYLIFEDFKAAGFEPVEVRSGYNGNDLGAYVEFRDERVAFFRADAGPRQAQRLVPSPRRDPRPLPRPACPSPGDVRPGASREFGRDPAPGEGLRDETIIKCGLRFTRGRRRDRAQVLDVFNPHAQPNQPVIDAASRSDVRRDAGVRHGGRVTDERFHAAETLSQAEQPGSLQHAVRSSAPPFSRMLIMPPKSRICRAATS